MNQLPDHLASTVSPLSHRLAYSGVDFPEKCRRKSASQFRTLAMKSSIAIQSFPLMLR
jgi:hypothetical protein